MSEVRLILRDAQREISGTCHGSTAERTIAALSAEPETLEELGAALGRFEQPTHDRFFACFCPGINDEPYDAGLVVIDLAARVIASDSTYSHPNQNGSVSYHDGNSATDDWINYRLPDDWQIMRDAWNWDAQCEPRRRVRLALPPLDARAVLYGPPLLKWIATECFREFHAQPGQEAAAFALAEVPDDDNWRSFDDDGPPRTECEQLATRDIHARWLLSPRSDLRNQPPRDLLLARKDFINLDLQDREFQWSTQKRCPPGLDPQSHAYRFGGFGTHEIVIYYYLVRRLIGECRDGVAHLVTTKNAKMMTAGDFLATEVPRLKKLLDHWLDTPDPEYHGRTPRSIIERERCRLPEGMSGNDAIIDHDCPLCQMMADGLSGPMFWHLDGCNMDQDFAFSFHATMEDWEAQERDYEEFNRLFNARQAEKVRLGVEYPDDGYADPDVVWERSFVAHQSAETPLYVRLFTIGSHLAELIVDLKHPTEDRRLIDQLSRDFGNLREVAHTDDFDRAAALIEPVIDRFCDTLAAVAAAQPGLHSKADDLSHRLRRFLEPPRPRTDRDQIGDDIPF